MKLRNFLTLAAVALVVSVSGLTKPADAGVGPVEPPPPPPPPLVFDFEGVCTIDCTGIATATLTLDGSYVLGTEFDHTDVIDFAYSSDFPALAGFDFVSASLGTSGILTSDPNLFADIFITGTAIFGESELPLSFEFGTAGSDDLEAEILAGDWFISEAGGPPRVVGPPPGEGPTLDAGTQGTWNPVPEPGTIALFVVGLVGLGALRRRTPVA